MESVLCFQRVALSGLQPYFCDGTQSFQFAICGSSDGLSVCVKRLSYGQRSRSRFSSGGGVPNVRDCTAGLLVSLYSKSPGGGELPRQALYRDLPVLSR